MVIFTHVSAYSLGLQRALANNRCFKLCSSPARPAWTNRTALDTADSSPIHRRSLTQRRPVVVRPRSHHTNTRFWAIPLGCFARLPASTSNIFNPSPNSRSASASPCARLASPRYEADRPCPSVALIRFNNRLPLSS